MRDAGGGGPPGNHTVSHGACATAARDPTAERTSFVRPAADRHPARDGHPAAHHRTPRSRPPGDEPQLTPTLGRERPG